MGKPTLEEQDKQELEAENWRKSVDSLKVKLRKRKTLWERIRFFTIELKITRS
jgi:hypothetical protein